jgi:hypothetical protein
MGWYRKIDPRIWNDSDFRELGDYAKLAFVFVLTHPNMTCLGAMRATMPGMAAELGWETRKFSAAFGEFAARGMVEVDDPSAYVGVPNFIKYNRPENPNVVTSWAKALDLVPECPLRTRQLARIRNFIQQKMSQPFRRAFDAAFSKLADELAVAADPVQDVKAAVDGLFQAGPPPEASQSAELASEPKTQPKAEPSTALPSALDTPAFRKAWANWQTYRQQIRKPIKPASVATLLGQLAELGPAEAVQRIERSIANGWQGLIFNNERNGHGNKRKTAAERGEYPEPHPAEIGVPVG